MSLLGSILTGAASMAGYAMGGPVGGALVGGIIGGLVAGFESGWDPEEMAEGAAFGAIGGLIPTAGFGVKGALGAGASLAKAAPTQLARTGLFKSTIPRALGGAHVAPWRTYAGLAGAASGPGLARSFDDKWDRYQAVDRGIPLIDITSPAAAPKMPRVMMPDPARLPEGLSLSSAVVDNYRNNLPGIYHANWQAFGAESRELMPKAWTAAPVADGEAANIPSYFQRVRYLGELYESLRRSDEAVAGVVEKTAAQVSEGREGLSSQIASLTDMAGVHPADTEKIQALVQEQRLSPEGLQTGSGAITEDTYVLSVLESVTARAEAEMRAATALFGDLAGEVQDPPAPPKEPEATAPKVDDAKGDGENTGTGSTPPVGDAVTVDPGTTVLPPAPLEWGSDPAGTTTDPMATRTGDLTGTSAQPGSAGGTGTSTGAGPAAGAGPQVSPATVAQPAAAAPASSSSGLDPLLQNAMMQRAMADSGRGTDRTGNRERPGQRRGSDIAQTANRTASQQSQSQQPAAARQQPGAQAQAGSTAANPAARTVSAPVTGAPPAATAGDGRELFTFPDGRTQLVSPVVAHALSLALSDHAGTDARAAYARTAIPLPPQGQPLGEPVGPSDLATGVVASWAPLPAAGPGATVTTASETERVTTAIVVAFDGAPPEVIVAGELRPFSESVQHGGLDFGAFGGFHRPAGVDVVAPGPGPVEQQVGAPLTVAG
ncbi:hypothetical protein [Nocardia sp. NPDC057227]|uniref:hypothetical protein n=1 Tax=Nocardia sp. NPDC057227 TaxID=3346056 RepID=UPI003626EA82